MRSDKRADAMITAVIRATATATCAMAGLAALAGAVITHLLGDTHWAVTWALVAALSVVLILQLGHASDIDRLTEAARTWRRTDVDAWRTSEPDPIDVDDVVRHITTGQVTVVEALEHRGDIAGAWVSLDDARRWVPLAVLRHADQTSEEADRG